MAYNFKIEKQENNLYKITYSHNSNEIHLDSIPLIELRNWFEKISKELIKEYSNEKASTESHKK